MQFACRFDDLTYPRIAELDHLSCFHIDKMVVLAALECSFKLGYVLPELMFCNKIAVEEKLNCVVECCSAYPVVLVLHENIKRFYIKMTWP